MSKASKESLLSAIAAAAFIGVTVFVLFWTLGSAKQVTITVTEKQYKAIAPENQNWQMTDEKGVRYAFSNVISYKRTHVGDVLRCRRTGHALKLPVLMDGLYTLSFCKKQQ
jgi:peroxiredoxin family protein